MSGVLVYLMAAVANTAGLEVDEVELEQVRDAQIEFLNYEGPVDRIDTIESIRGIGTYLGTRITTPGDVASYFGRYRVIHAVDPSVLVGLDADIVIIEPDAQVNHINNLRHIISAYLEAAYGYTGNDASTLAFFTTIYNAVHRQDVPFFDARYKPVVTRHLSPENAGLSTRYYEWPGMSRVVIPLARGAAPGVIGTIDPLQLTDPEVIAELRAQPDMGIRERKDIIDLMERVVAAREEREEQERLALERERRRLEQERIDRERTVEAPDEEIEPPEDPIDPEEAPVEEPDETPEPRVVDEGAEPLVTEEEREARERELAEREEALERDVQETEEMLDRVRELYDDTADDQHALLTEEQRRAEEAARVVPVPFLVSTSRTAAGVAISRLVGVHPETGDVLVRSDSRGVYGRRIVNSAGEVTAIVDTSDGPRLVTFERENLSSIRTGDDEIFPGASLERRGDDVFTVVRVNGAWYLGRFDSTLTLIEHSDREVAPATHIVITENRVYAEMPDGSVLSLELDDLGVRW